MKKLMKYFFIGLALITIMNVSLAGAQKLAQHAPTAYAQDEGEEAAPETAEEAEDGEAARPAVEGEDSEVEPLSESPQELSETISQGARSILLQFSQILSVVLLALNYLLWPILMMIGALMDNSIIFGGGMEDRLLQIWSQIRNIVNLLFVVILIGMAIYNVLGVGEEGNYTIKKILPKFIIALIVVNFTFIGAKVALDAANVATNAIFALPNSVEEEFNLTRVDQLESAVCGQLDDLGALGGQSISQDSNLNMCADNNNFTANARQFFQRLSSNNIALVMAVNMGQIHEGLQVSELVRNEPSVPNLTINMLFSIILYIVYATAFIALFFVLLVRVVVLWMVIALSPLVAIGIVAPDLAQQLGGGGRMNPQELFVQHLIAPIVIGFGMTVGYLMLDAYQATTGNALGIQLGAQFANSFSGVSTLQQLLIGIGAIAIVWVVTFEAANKTLASEITGRMKNWVRQVGGGIAQLPLTIPIIPVPETVAQGGGISPLAIPGAVRGGIQDRLDQARRAGRNRDNNEGTEIAPLDRQTLNRANNGNFSSITQAQALAALSHFRDPVFKSETTVGGIRTLAQSARDPQLRGYVENNFTDEQMDTTLNNLDSNTRIDLENRIQRTLNNQSTTSTETVPEPITLSDSNNLSTLTGPNLTQELSNTAQAIRNGQNIEDIQVRANNLSAALDNTDSPSTEMITNINTIRQSAGMGNYIDQSPPTNQ